VRVTAPKLGQHTGAILAGLGYSPSDIEALRGDRVI
jgi:crotonobetainyl-CoA:carnitine CoA-transferase CaiB-like acyl-CoA transferase